ncbi:MAG: hypothetical protein LH478_05390 [Chitinophagaceae bacterium]|nr:hypothetical protein [Chitinophagaceae bacterium]
MTNFGEKWHLYFVPECYFDTILFKKLLQTTKRLVHRKGCNNVANDLDSERLRDLFAVALIDKDKRELDYLKSCKVLYDDDKLILWKHLTRLHFIIQLNPPLEHWIVTILGESGVAIEDLGYSGNFKRLKKQIKLDINSENDEKLNRLVSAVIKTDCQTIRKMRAMLVYLKEKNYMTDINELKNVGTETII